MDDQIPSLKVLQLDRLFVICSLSPSPEDVKSYLKSRFSLSANMYLTAVLLSQTWLECAIHGSIWIDFHVPLFQHVETPALKPRCFLFGNQQSYHSLSWWYHSQHLAPVSGCEMFQIVSLFLLLNDVFSPSTDEFSHVSPNCPFSSGDFPLPHLSACSPRLRYPHELKF